MTKDGDYKRVVRRRARASGERYSEARARLETDAGERAGFAHEVGFYGSDREFQALAVPFAEEALDAGEPVVFAYDRRKTDLLRRWLPDAPLVTYLAERCRYQSPTKTLATWRALAEAAMRSGASRIRCSGEVPHPGHGRPYTGWDRYEAAIDDVLGDLALWGRCLYDLRVAPAEVVASARHRHRHVLASSGRRRENPDYMPPRHLAEFLHPDPDPLEQEIPSAELVDPSPAGARAAIRAVAGGRLDAAHLDDLLLATSEAVTNALVHGAPPVVLRVWAGDDRVVAVVDDRGRGPDNALVGLGPLLGDGGGGRGLWLAHQLDVDIALLVSSGGFAVRLRAGQVVPSGLV